MNGLGEEFGRSLEAVNRQQRHTGAGRVALPLGERSSHRQPQQQQPLCLVGEGEREPAPARLAHGNAEGAVERAGLVAKGPASGFGEAESAEHG